MASPELPDILNDCIDRLNAGATIADCLAQYPQHASALRPMLEAGQLTRRDLVTPAEIAYAQERARFRVVEALETRQQRPRAPRRQFLAALAALLLLAFTSVGVLAQASLPGDPLYQTKRLTESIVATLTGQPAEQQFAARRLDEVRQLQALGRAADVTFRGLVTETDGQEWRIAGLPVTVPDDTPGAATININDRASVEAMTTDAGQVIARRLTLLERGDPPPPTPTVIPPTATAVTPSASPTTVTATPTMTETPLLAEAPTTPSPPADDAAPTITPTTATTGECVPSRPDDWATYRVQPGDTLSLLASLTGTTLAQLQQVNCIEDVRFIVVGQQLFLPFEPQRQEPPAPPQQPGDSGGQPPAPPPPGPSNPGNGDDDGSDDDDDDDDD